MCVCGVLLTADVQVYGVAPLAVRVLEAAVQPVVAQVHLGQDEPRALQPVRRLDVGAIHLPRHRGVVVQGAALHGDVAARLAVLVPSHCKHTQQVRCELQKQVSLHKEDQWSHNELRIKQI